MSNSPRMSRTVKPGVRIKLTGPGWLFMALALLVAIAAVRAQAQMLFLLFGCMLGAVILSAFLARTMLSGLTVQRDLPQRVWQYESVYFGYFLRNTRRRLPCLGLVLREIDPIGIEDTVGYCLHLPARTAFRSGSRLVAERRGRIRLRGIRLSTGFPFGLLHAFRDISDETDLVVWPAKGRLRSDVLVHGALQASSAPAGRIQGGQDEFFGLREYRQGDNPRWIHWRRSAGRRAPIVREMAHPVPDLLFLLIDLAPGSNEQNIPATREKVLRFAATLVDHAQSRGFQVGMAIAFDNGPRVFSGGASLGTRTDLLDALAEADAQGADFQQVLNAVPRKRISQAQVLLISPDLSMLPATMLPPIREAARHLQVLGPAEMNVLFEDNRLVDSMPEFEPIPQAEVLHAGH